MKKIIMALSVASSVTGFLAWVEAHSGSHPQNAKTCSPQPDMIQYDRLPL